MIREVQECFRYGLREGTEIPTVVLMNETLNTRVAAEIRAEMARQRISGRRVAERIGKPFTTVARWLRTGEGWDLDELDAITAVLGISIPDLIDRAQSNRPDPSGAAGGRREIVLPRLDSNQQPSGYKLAAFPQQRRPRVLRAA